MRSHEVPAAPPDEVLEEVFFQSINMSAPLQARKWLALLEENKDSGIRIRPNLTLDNRRLGFSFSSNELGLRGPAARKAPTVIFGTSYAMGFSVNEGQNWYDGIDFLGGALNLGLPVGMHEMSRMHSHYHEGPRQTAIVLYHPNFWSHAMQYRRLRESGNSAFAFFNWDLSLQGALGRQLSLVQKASDPSQGGPRIYKIENTHYLLNPSYARFKRSEVDAYEEDVVTPFCQILNEFDRVLVIRIPTKEELAVGPTEDPKLSALKDNHRLGWHHFSERIISRLSNPDVIEDAGFLLNDFLPCDTHWNASGNTKMRKLLLENRAISTTLLAR